ncbi:flagellar export protein FliJ [Clostridium algidicarnis]|mgnify:FL=1|uniref:Flagellar FliJ protein n=1 Tax=Clostridium algidicarnis TaxID=37659 RepID=A0ABS6BZA1_9CLOT|nr:flagellar export protein FliJ [Clostridium algidicarnis]MBB6630454.1 flagellar export protein FliJ [Clostridium algidicarnis]MBU3218554.1 flagellar export protein FliJ [Clostridium algidicarnis]MCB2286541.1 flagellar export protein FliJ [Clostridium algidicarnis]
MALFNFRLQKLLDIRTEKEEESKRNFKEAQGQKDKVENSLNNMKQNYSRYNSVTVKEDVVQQKIRRNYLYALNTSIDEKTIELNKKIIVLDKKREELKEKQIDRKTVEILKDKKKIEFLDIEKHVEQVQNDEFALYGYIRNREGR